MYREACQVLDIVLFIGAITYGFLRHDELNYVHFKDSKNFLLYFRGVLFVSFLLYVGIAYAGGISSLGLMLYAIYIASLLAWEDYVYTKKIHYLVSVFDLLAIEIVREVLLLYGGFWSNFF